MTMHIYFEKDKDGYVAGWSGYVERTLARRFCENSIAIPYQQHLKEVKEAEENRKAALLKKREQATAENAASKKAPRRSKAIKKVFKK